MRQTHSLAVVALVVAVVSSHAETRAAGWMVTSATMSTPHAQGLSVLLSSNKLLVVGGASAATTVNSVAETYDPKTKLWTTMKASPTARQFGAVVTLASGKHLFIGGTDGTGTRLSNADVFDGGAWVSAKAMNGPRGAAVAAAVPGGAIVAGGSDGSATSELYDEAANTWTTIAMASVRVGAGITVLADGRVMVSGGLDGSTGTSAALSTVEIYDPSAKVWTAGPSMAAARARHVSVRLTSGKVLVAGGNQRFAIDPGPNDTLSSSEIFDPATSTWSAAKPMTAPRGWPGVAALSGGRILVAGGFTAPAGVISTVEVYDPATDVWTAANAMGYRRVRPLTGVFADGSVIVASGLAAAPLDTAEIFAAENGEKCSADLPCRSGHCVDGFCCDMSCEGQCLACDRAGQEGTCGPVVGAPHGSRAACSPSAGACVAGGHQAAAACDGSGTCKTPAVQSCGNYACAAAGCPTTCVTTAECATGFSCLGTSCVPRAARCDDGVTSVDTSTGKATACAPYRCATDGTCLQSCGTSNDCAPGNVCDSTLKACTAPAPAEAADGGCSTSPPRAFGASFALAAVAAAFAAARARRPERRRAR